ncbi:MAG: AAA family ATPase [Planctomycetes bacterium]|nr:AAA family ATPase [Planctomycetota bacterium]
MIEPVIKKLILKRFRSFPQAQADFDNPTFFVGHNGSGKSNLSDAFSFLAESMSSPLQAVFDRRGGITSVRNRTAARGAPTNLGLGVEFGPLNGLIDGGRFAFEVKAIPTYGFEVVREQCLVRFKKGRFWFDRTKKFRTNVEGLKPSLDAASLCLPVVGGDDRFAPVLRMLAAMRVYSIQPQRLREMQDPDSGTALRPDGSNAASVLQELSRLDSKAVEDASELLKNIVPGTEKFRPKKHGNKLSIEFEQKWSDKNKLNFEAFSMSDGTLRALGLLMAVFQRPTPTLIAVEEPEATIHPGALGAILDMLLQAAKSMQVVVTTHSPELLDAEWIKDSNLRVVSWAAGASHIMLPPESAKTAMKDHLMGAGELMRANALEPAEELFKAQETLGMGALFEELE